MNRIIRKQSAFYIQIFAVFIITVLLTVMGCATSEENSSAQNTPDNSRQEENLGGEPSPLISYHLSFPDGAPALNQEAILSFVINARSGSLEDVTAKLRIPESLELISGNLIWNGDMVANETEVIRAVVKATEMGSGRIDYYATWDQTAQKYDTEKPSPGFVTGIYFLVSEDSGDWNRNLSYDRPNYDPVVKDGKIINIAQPSSSNTTETPSEDLPPPPEVEIRGFDD